MTHTPLLRIYNTLRLFHDRCNADELIGVRACLRLMRYCIKQNTTFNLELRNRQLERENKRLFERIAKLELQCDDLREDNKVLSKRCKDMQEFNPDDAKIYRNYDEGFYLLELVAWEEQIKVWVNAPKTFIEKNIDEALRQSIPNKKPKYPIDYTRQNIINFFRKAGFKAK